MSSSLTPSPPQSKPKPDQQRTAARSRRTRLPRTATTQDPLPSSSPSPPQPQALKHFIQDIALASGVNQVNSDHLVQSNMMGSLPLLFFFLLLISGVRFSGSVRLGNGGYEEWRLGTATYIKESQGHPLNDGGGACGYGDLDIFRYGRYTTGLSSALFGRGSACGACYELRCVNNILWCLRGSPTVVVTATDFCAPNFGLPDDFGGWCNFPREHLEMTEAAFLRVAKAKADIVQVQFRRVSCDRAGGMRFTITGGASFLQVLITNVAADGEVIALKVKGSRTGWIPMGRNWGQNWQCNADLQRQPLSFEVTGKKGRTFTMYNVAPSDWMFAQTFEGKQLVE